MCGTAAIVSFLQKMRFSEDDIAFLKTVSPLRAAFTPEFEAYLRSFRFSGELWIMDEGSVFFENEPVLRITAPLIEAQLAETFVLSILNHDVKVCSKAARVVQAAGIGKTLIEMGTRRTYPEAAVAAARAAYIAGFDATSNVEAGRLYGVPLAGTVAHMWTMAHAEPGIDAAESELRAFRAFVDVYHNPTLLIDTYDTETGLNNAVTAAGTHLAAVRIDSGDLDSESRHARHRLDVAGLKGARIIVRAAFMLFSLQL
jgi:nicotinate phosphoribosyltransferase